MTHATHFAPTTSQRLAIIFLALYALGRLCQLISADVPILFTVSFHVIPPALFALIHGACLYGRRGIALFTIICLGCASILESLSLRTGFPYGHYVFTEVMGPKLFQLPILLALAYLGIGYSAWILANLILSGATKRFASLNLLVKPLLASAIFTAWDLSMEADWATLDRAWLWRDGGVWFGVPLTNFLGWLFTGYLIFQLFALAELHRPAPLKPPSFWRLPVILYALCAAGNLLLLIPSPAAVTYASTVYDATGHPWHTASILLSVALVSIILMGSFAALAWRRATWA